MYISANTSSKKRTARCCAAPAGVHETPRATLWCSIALVMVPPLGMSRDFRAPLWLPVYPMLLFFFEVLLRVTWCSSNPDAGAPAGRWGLEEQSPA